MCAASGGRRGAREGVRSVSCAQARRSRAPLPPPRVYRSLRLWSGVPRAVAGDARAGAARGAAPALVAAVAEVELAAAGGVAERERGVAELLEQGGGDA